MKKGLLKQMEQEQEQEQEDLDKEQELLNEEPTIFDIIKENIKGQAVATVMKKQSAISTIDLECGTFTFSTEIEFKSNLDTIATRYGGGIYKVYIKTMQGKFVKGIPAPLFYNYAESEKERTPANIIPTSIIEKPDKSDDSLTKFLMTSMQSEKDKADRFMELFLRNEQETSKRLAEIQALNNQQIQSMNQQFSQFMQSMQTLIFSSKQKEEQKDAVKTLIELKSAGLLPDNKGLSGTDIKDLILTGLDLANAGMGTGKTEDKGIMGDIAEILKTAVDLIGTKNKVLGQKIHPKQIPEIQKSELPNKELLEAGGRDMPEQPKKPELKNEIEQTVYKEGAVLENFCNYDVNVQAVTKAILSRIPEAYDKRLCEWLQTEPNRIYEILPFLANNKEWTESLKSEIILSLNPDGEVIPHDEKPDKEKSE